MTTLTADRRRPATDPTVAVLPPRVNLLPVGIAARHRLRRLQLAVGCLLLVVVGAVASLSLQAAEARRDAGRQLDAASARGAVLQAESVQYVDVLAVHRGAQAAQDRLVLAMANEVRFSELLDDLSRTIPDDVWLEDVRFSQAATTSATVADAGTSIGTVTFTGGASSHDDVAAWLEALASQEGYADPSLTDSTALAGEQGTVTFNSTVTLTSAALSGRHTSTTARD